MTGEPDERKAFTSGSEGGRRKRGIHMLPRRLPTLQHSTARAEPSGSDNTGWHVELRISRIYAVRVSMVILFERRQRQSKPEGGPLARYTVDADLAAVALHDYARNVEA